MVDQESFNPGSWPSRYIWLFYCIGIFVIVLGYFSNLMSTDIVALKKMPEIKKFEDYFGDDFKAFAPMIFNGFWFYAYAKASAADSLVGRLLGRATVNAYYGEKLGYKTGLLMTTLDSMEGLIETRS